MASPGFVYLIEEVPHPLDKSGPWTKIGQCAGRRVPNQRCKELARGHPRGLRAVAEYVFEDDVEAHAAEKKAKSHFHGYRVQE